MIEALDLRSDLLSSKSFRGQPITMEMLNKARDRYLQEHPEARVLPSVTPGILREPPSAQSPEFSTYIISRFK